MPEQHWMQHFSSSDTGPYGLPLRAVCRGGLAGALLTLAVCAVQPAAAADVALGQYLSGECTGCHTLSGQAAGGIPAIVGIAEDRFVAALSAYKNGERNNPVMRTIAGRLSEEEIAALAAFFAAQKP